MNIKIVSVILSVAFVFLISSVTIFAAAAPTINSSTIAYQDSNYVIFGTSVATQVSIRIIGSSGEIKLFDVQNVLLGKYSTTVTISASQFPIGTYMVDVTDINGSSSQRLAVKILPSPSKDPRHIKEDVKDPKPEPSHKAKNDKEIKEQGKKTFAPFTREVSHFE